MPGYLYRRIGAGQAPWNTTELGGTPPDAGTPAAPPMPLPRPSSPLRACAAAFVLLLSATPPDAGSAPVPTSCPDRAPAARRASPSAYRVITGTPRDAGVAAASWPASDTFTDATGAVLSSHTPDSGGTWTLHPSYSGTALIDAANRLRQNNTTASCYYLDVAPPSADYDVSVDLNRLTTGAFPSTGGICGRLDPTTDTCYSVRSEIQGTNWVLVKRVAGTETSLGTSSTPTPANGTPNTPTLRMAGTTISLLVDGVSKVSVTDSSITAAGKAGVRFTAINQAPTDTTLIHLDNFAAQDIPTPVFPPQSQPFRAAGPRWASPSAYVALASPTPGDSGVSVPGPVGPGYPDLARGRVRAASRAYQTPQPVPRDPGDPSSPAECPDLARGPARAATSAYLIAAQPTPDAVGFVGPRGDRRKSRYLYRPPVEVAPYTLIVAPPPDAGAAVQDPVSVQAMPDRAGPTRRAPASAYSIVVAPPSDAGSIPISAVQPDRAAAARRASASAYLVATGTPPDAGAVVAAPAIPAEYPDSARGPLRGQTPPTPLSVTPRDAGPLPVPTALPDRAAGPRRAAAHAYTIVVGTPGDSGVVLTPPSVPAEYPDSAPGRRRAAPATYVALVSASPRDAGPTPVPASGPHRADRARPAGNAAYRILTGTPPDQGAVPGPIRPQYPDRAPGGRRTAAEAYTIVVPSPADAGVLSGYRIYANAGAGGPIDYTSPVGSTPLLIWTSGVLTFPADWKFGVRAYDGISGLEERNVEAVVRLRLDASGADVTAIPDAPAELSGRAAAAGAIALDWAYSLVDPARRPTGFHVYSGTGGVVGYGSPVATVAYTPGTIHFAATVAGGTDGVAYTFGVRAYNATGEESNVATTTITADATAPTAVITFTATATA